MPQAPQRPPRAVPIVNPFLGVPVADFVKDGAAALALLVALGQPWDWSSDANDHWWVVISLLLALVGLGVPYLMASRVVPTFTPQASIVAKLLLAAPLLVSTLVALVMDLTTIGDDDTLGRAVARLRGRPGAGDRARPRRSRADGAAAPARGGHRPRSPSRPGARPVSPPPWRRWWCPSPPSWPGRSPWPTAATSPARPSGPSGSPPTWCSPPCSSPCRWSRC